MLTASIHTAIPRYASAMKGTMYEQTFAILWIPPKMTARDSRERRIAIAIGGIENASVNADEMVLACTILLVSPNCAKIAIAKITANQRLCRPFVM